MPLNDTPRAVAKRQEWELLMDQMNETINVLQTRLVPVMVDRPVPCAPTELADACPIVVAMRALASRLNSLSDAIALD